MTDWADETRPRNRAEWVCTPQVRNQVERVFFASWYHNSPLFKALLVHGQQGCGKSSLVYAFAGPLGWNIVEHNMSLIESASSSVRDIVHFTQRPFDARGRRNIVLLDEVDSLPAFARETIKGIVENSRIPVVLTANWPGNLNIDNMLVVEIKPPNVKMKMEFLQRVCREKSIQIEDYKLEAIVDVCKTLRGCAIALQRCVEYGAWRGVQRPSEDVCPEEELLDMLHGKTKETEWDVRKYLSWGSINGVSPRELANLRYIHAMSYETSLESIPTDYMMLLRSKVTVVRKPKYREGKFKRVKKRAPPVVSTAQDEKRDAVEFKSVGASKVVMKKRVVKSTTAQSLW